MPKKNEIKNSNENENNDPKFLEKDSFRFWCKWQY